MLITVFECVAEMISNVINTSLVGVLYMHAPSSQLRLLHKVLDVNTSALGSEPRVSLLRHGEAAGLVSQVIEQAMLVYSSKTRSGMLALAGLFSKKKKKKKMLLESLATNRRKCTKNAGTKKEKKSTNASIGMEEVHLDRDIFPSSTDS